MLDISGTIFERYHNDISFKGTVVVSIDDGSTTWLISETDMHLTDGHVYPILKSNPVISENVDVQRKNWSISNLSLTVSNEPYKKDSSNNWVSFSDEIEDLLEADVDVYFSIGEGITQLSDMLLRYSGIISDSPIFDFDSVKITAYDKGKTITKSLPQTLVTDIYSGIPSNFNEEKIPIVYGDFTFDSDDMNRSGLGLAKAIPISRTVAAKIFYI